MVLRRKVRGRAQLTNNDRWFFVQMYQWFPSILEVATVTCRNPVSHTKTGPLQLNSSPTSQPAGCQGARLSDCLLQRRIRMLFDRLLEKQCHLIRFAKNSRGATNYGECAGNIT